ncbi:MAG: tetratricopeptide repeat protein [bacterium]|nr:tetratricopeptide repeat protein [bacterium]
MNPPLTGRTPLPLSDGDQRRLLRTPHPLDERDPFATDADPDIRRLGRLALRRDDVNDLFALGDLCARRIFTADERLLVFYVGKALIAYRRAAERAHSDIDRLMAQRAARTLIDWVSEMAQQYPTRRNIAVALWAAADDEPFPEAYAPGDEAARTGSTGEFSTRPTNPAPLDERTRFSDSGTLSDSGGLTDSGDTDTRFNTDDLPLSPAALGSLLSAYLHPLKTPRPDAPPDDSLERTLAADSDSGLIDMSMLSQGDEQDDESEIPSDSLNPDDDSQPFRNTRLAPPPKAPLVAADMLDTFGDRDSEMGDSRVLSSEPIGGANDTQFHDEIARSISSFENHAHKQPKPRSTPRPLIDLSAGEFNIGDMIDGRYEVADVRRGGMGVVYLCYDYEQRAPVALKSFQSRFLDNERAVARFQQEAFTWIRLEKHRHIVQARLVQNIAGRPHIILEHISGPEGLEADLRSWIDHKRLTLRHAVEFGLHIALGMQHATSKIPGLVHRDLKPANILVTHDGIAKVTDFGLVRSLDLADRALDLADLPLLELEARTTHESGPHTRPTDERLTRVGAIIGTAPYMSPEQARSGNVDLRADIYAFGCLLYEMVTGHHVFAAKKLDSWLHAHLNETPAFDSTAAALPARLQALILGCLEKDPAHRPGAWHSIVDELRAIFVELTGENPILEITGPALEARELMDKGYSLTELGKLDEALEAYDAAITLQADYAWAWARKGRTLRLLTRYQDAIQCYDEALRIQPNYAWAWKGKGIVLERLGQPLEALDAYQQASRIDPNDVWNWYNQADALQNMGRYDEAVALLKQALELDAAHPNSWAKLGQVYRLMQDFHSAITAYEHAIELDPSYAWAQNGYGLALKALGLHKEALLAFKRASRYQPDEVWHWYNLTEMLVELRQYEEAQQPAHEAVRINQGHAYSWAKLGQVLRYVKKYDEALAAYDRAIRLQPDYAWAINGRGIVLEQLERYEEALECYRQASRLGKNDVWHYYNQGNVLALLGQYDQAQPLLEEAVQLNPNHARSWARLGNVYRQLGKYDEALKAYHNATELDAMYAWAWNEMGMTYERLEQPDQALDAYRHAADSDSGDPHYIYQQVDLLTARGDHASALALLETALKRDGRISRTWAKHGQILRRVGRIQEALRSYTRSVELDPLHAWAWNGRGLVLAALNQHEEALQCFRKAAAIDPNDTWYWYNQGDELIALNRFGQAVEVLERALKLNPTHTESWAKLGQAFRRLNRQADALNAYDQALAINPHYAWAWNGRGLTLESLGRREEAIASYERALEEDDGIIWYYTNQVDLLLEMRREAQALVVIDRALTVLPENAMAWARKGQIMRRLRDFEAALEAYQMALERDPAYGWAWNGKALAYAALGRWEEALICNQRAVQHNANDAWFWHNLGETNLALGDCEQAVIALEKALTLDANHQPSRNKLIQARDCLAQPHDGTE